MSTNNISLSLYKRKTPLIIPNIIISAAMRFFQGRKYEFEIAVVNEPSVFEPFKLYCK